MDINQQEIRHHLDGVHQHLAGLRIVLGLTPHQGAHAPAWVDDLLSADEAAQEARRDVMRGLEALGEAHEVKARQRALLAAEEAVNHMLARALDMGWSAGLSAAEVRT